MATYLSIVNDAIIESGADLDTFEVDGSDFDSMGHDSLMYKFKTWTRRAWQTIQQESYDWQFMAQQAVVNINPGVLVYTSGFNTAGIEDINVAAIVDANGDTQVSDLYAFNYRLIDTLDPPAGTIDVPAGPSKNLASFDILYNDYTPTNQHAIDFGLKSGSWRLTRGDGEKYKFRVVSNSPESLSRYPLFSVGDTVDRVDLSVGGGPVSYTLPLTGATVVALSLEDSFLTMDIESDSSTIPLFDQLLTYALSISTANEIGVEVVVDVGNGTKSVEGTIGIVALSGRPTATISISPMTYSVTFTGNLFAQSSPYIGQVCGILNTVVTDPFGATGVLATHTQAVVDFLSPASSGSATDGILTLNVTNDIGHTYSVTSVDLPDPVCWSMWLLLMYSVSTVPSCVRSFITGTLDEFLSTRILVNMYDMSTTTVMTTYDVEYELPYLFKNYIHSWKSYHWDEELGVDDFVESIADLDEQSFRLITKELPGPGIEVKLPFMHWELFRQRYDNTAIAPSQPRVITKDNTGRYRFFPAPDRPYTILFDFVRKPQVFEAFDDVPEGIPDDYADLIMWLTVIYYAQYDEQPSVERRATKNYKDMMFRLQMLYRDTFHFVPARLY